MTKLRRYHVQGQLEEHRLLVLRAFVGYTLDTFGHVYDGRHPEAHELVQAMRVVRDLLEVVDRIYDRPAKIKFGWSDKTMLQSVWRELYKSQYGHYQKEVRK